MSDKTIIYYAYIVVGVPSSTTTGSKKWFLFTSMPIFCIVDTVTAAAKTTNVVLNGKWHHIKRGTKNPKQCKEKQCNAKAKQSTAKQN